MGERDSYAPGTFCWAAVDQPAGEAGTYTTFKLDGHDIAALYEMGEEERSSITPHWSSYVSVEDVDELAPKVLELGGEVLAHPFDVMRAGRMTALKDPTGATVHLWQPREQIGAERVNDAGCMVWNELATPDPARARDFFAALLGWTVEPEESGYGVIKNKGALNGGIRPPQDGEPIHWLVYFTAAALDDSLANVREAGGSVIAGPMATPVGRVAAVRDPQGAAFALFEGET